MGTRWQLAGISRRVSGSLGAWSPGQVSSALTSLISKPLLAEVAPLPHIRANSWCPLKRPRWQLAALGRRCGPRPAWPGRRGPELLCFAALPCKAPIVIEFHRACYYESSKPTCRLMLKELRVKNLRCRRTSVPTGALCGTGQVATCTEPRWNRCRLKTGCSLHKPRAC